MALTKVTGAVKVDRPFDTVDEMVNARGIKVGEEHRTAEFSAGNGGGGTYDVVLTTSVTPNGFNIIQSVADPTISFVLRVEGPVDLKQWGAGIGLTDDRPIIQSAITQGYLNFENSDGTYLIGASGNTMVYRATTTNTGVELPSNVVFRGSGYNTVFKVIDSGNCVPLTADAKTNVTIDNLRVDGNASNQTASLLFGIYCLDCTGVNIGQTKVWVEESKDNTFEAIGCTDVNYGTTESNTSTGGGSIGGGPQFENCVNVSLGQTIFDTYDDGVAIIAHEGDSSDLNLGDIMGVSANSRALFIGQSNSSTTQRFIKNIKASVNSNNCGAIGLTGACVVSRGGIYDNFDISIIDRDSYRTFELNPFDGTFNGQVSNCKFNIASLNATVRAVNITTNDNVNTTIEHCKLNVIAKNANSSDSASENDAVRIALGDYWDMNVSIEYPAGKTNVGQGMVLGGSNTNDFVRYAQVRGSINGGNKNLQLNNCENNNLDNLVLRNTEDSNNISLDITASAVSTRVGDLTRDGEIQDDSTSTQRNWYKLFSSSTNNATSGTGETDLTSYTLPADWMGKTGALHIKASGVISGGNDNKTLTFYFGSTPHVLHPAANDTGDWSADIYIHQAGTRASQRLDIVNIYGTSVLVNDGVSDGESTTGAVTIKFTGQTVNASDSVSQRMMVIEGA